MEEGKKGKLFVVVLGQGMGNDTETSCSGSRSTSGRGEKTGKLLVVVLGQQA